MTYHWNRSSLSLSHTHTHIHVHIHTHCVTRVGRHIVETVHHKHVHIHTDTHTHTYTHTVSNAPGDISLKPFISHIYIYTHTYTHTHTVSRALGDISLKPFIMAEPDVVTLRLPAEHWFLVMGTGVCVVVCCSVLQCVAVCCSVLHVCVAALCRVLQCGNGFRVTLQHAECRASIHLL